MGKFSTAPCQCQGKCGEVLLSIYHAEIYRQKWQVFYTNPYNLHVIKTTQSIVLVKFENIASHGFNFSVPYHCDGVILLARGIN